MLIVGIWICCVIWVVRGFIIFFRISVNVFVLEIV